MNGIKCDDDELERIYGVCYRCGEKIGHGEWRKFDESRKVGECVACHEGRHREDIGNASA